MKHFIPSDLDLKIELVKRGYEELTTAANFTKCTYFASILYIKKHLHREPWDVYHHLSSKTLELLLGSRYLSIIKKALLEIGLIEVRLCNGKETYKSRHSSKAYRIGKKFWACPFISIDASDSFKERACKLRIKQTEVAISDREELRFIFESLNRIELDYTAGIKFLDIAPKKNSSSVSFWNWCLESLRSKHLYLSCDTNGRIYTNITNLPKELRTFLSFKGKRLTKVDISSSHPCLLSKFYSARNEEYFKYIDVLKQGILYDLLNKHLSDSLDLTHPDIRSNFKKRVFKEVFYAHRYQGSTELTCAFQGCFPNLFETVHTLKDRGSSFLPNELMRIEADIVINRAARQITKALRPRGGFLLSLHDCLITEESDIEYVSNVLQTEYENVLGFRPNVECSDF